MYHEDPDWNIRAREKRFKSYYVPNAIVYHDASTEKFLLETYFLIRNCQILVWKHGSILDIFNFYYFFLICYIRLLKSELIKKKK
jgi:GT2 family glycosyltransferase